jgi:MarR family transcriptional regulator, organic hydroperoxide resistance regulator
MNYRYQDAISYRIQRIFRTYRQHIEASLTDLGLYPGQEHMLNQLWDNEGITQSELVEKLCVDPSTVTKSLQRLEKVGFVERKQDAEDSRVSRVYLTAAGRALHEPLQKIWCDLEQLTLQGLTDVEIALMRRIFDQIETNLGE